MASPEGVKRGRGRPRNPKLDGMILTATIELLIAGGEPAASLDDVAARAGVGKATIYRRWETKRDLILDAAVTHLPIELPTVDRGSLAADARALLAAVHALLATPPALAARQVLTQLGTWPELAQAYRTEVLGPWRSAVHAVATRAHHRGEISDPAGLQLALEAAAAQLCMQWVVHPTTITDSEPTDTADRIEALLGTVVLPQVPTGAEETLMSHPELLATITDNPGPLRAPPAPPGPHHQLTDRARALRTPRRRPGPGRPGIGPAARRGRGVHR